MVDQAAPARREEGDAGVFIYGIVPGDVEPEPAAQGIGDEAGRVVAVRYGDVAALASEIPLDQPIGRPADLIAYQRLLDGTATVAPVLPVRFGAVLTGSDAVEDLLAEHHDEFAAALTELEGQLEYIINGRYVEETIFREVLAENPQLVEVREQIRGRSEEETSDLRIAMGEAINQAVEAKRAADTQLVVDRLGPVATQSAVRAATHEQDAANVAFLVEASRQAEFTDALEGLAADWDGRVTLRLRGPLAPYDFVSPMRQGT